MNWATGDWTSVPDDGRCFLEKGNHNLWYVYKTDEEGVLLKDFPKVTEESFPTVEAAQQWAERNVPAQDFGAADPVAYARVLQESRTRPIRRLRMLRARFLLTLPEAVAADETAKGSD